MITSESRLVLEASLRHRIDQPIAQQTSTWERETGRGVCQHISYGEYHLPLSGKEEVVIQEECSSISSRVWDSAVLVSKWLESIMLQQQCSLQGALNCFTNKQNDTPSRPLKVLELGAGTGLLSVVLARLGASVMATEYGSAVDQMKLNCHLNGVLSSSFMQAGKVCCRELDWFNTRESVATLLQGEEFPVFDVIIVTDCSLTPKDSLGVLSMVQRFATRHHTIAIVGVNNEREGTQFFKDQAERLFGEVVSVPRSEWHPDFQSSRHEVLVIQQ